MSLPVPVCRDRTPHPMGGIGSCWSYDLPSGCQVSNIIGCKYQGFRFDSWGYGSASGASIFRFVKVSHPDSAGWAKRMADVAPGSQFGLARREGK